MQECYIALFTQQDVGLPLEENQIRETQLSVKIGTAPARGGP
jgi:hypothetical protein